MPRYRVELDAKIFASIVVEVEATSERQAKARASRIVSEDVLPIMDISESCRAGFNAVDRDWGAQLVEPVALDTSKRPLDVIEVEPR